MERERKSQWKYVKEKKENGKEKGKVIESMKKKKERKSNGKEKERVEKLEWKREWERERGI